VPVSVSRRTGKVTSWLLSLCLFDRNCSATVEFLTYRLPARIADSSSTKYRKVIRFNFDRREKLKNKIAPEHLELLCCDYPGIQMNGLPKGFRSEASVAVTIAKKE